jgi:2,4-dienoyl-CoA reductase-like NADH-dependent reductase (Old Yellow Enzyme family)
MSIDAETRRRASPTSPVASPARPSSPSPCAWSTRPPAPSIPILGMGGIVTPEDAVEFLLAGATAVQVGTASYADPRAVERLATASNPGAAATASKRSPASPAPSKFRTTEREAPSTCFVSGHDFSRAVNAAKSTGL